MRADRLRQLRLQSGHTLESLGELLSIDRQQVWRWESGKTVPSADTLKQIASVLGVSADYLLGLVDDPTPHMRVDNLTTEERRVLAALRRSEYLEAIETIVTLSKK